MDTTFKNHRIVDTDTLFAILTNVQTAQFMVTYLAMDSSLSERRKGQAECGVECLADAVAYLRNILSNVE